MTIQILDQNTAEQIAAGEVIENPASVVKELVENSLDAKADRIDIELTEGGKKFIAVTDNGIGIDPEQLLLAFKRFATSKISSFDDLNRIMSLGFRGEALPSIAAVARVNMVSRPAAQISGSLIEIAGGEIISTGTTGAPPGTRVEVKELFFNTPGRLKFLKTSSAESTKVSNLVSEMSLAHPEVSFSLKSGGRMLFKSEGDGNLLHAVGAVYGSETAESMLALERAEGEDKIKVDGFTSAPRLTRSSRRWITVTVNGRLVKIGTLVNAVERAYGDLLSSGRHPLAILRLTVPPGLLDVNVHPAKTEIRFQNAEDVKSLIFRAVKETLREERQLPRWPGFERINEHLSDNPVKSVLLQPEVTRDEEIGDRHFSFDQFLAEQERDFCGNLTVSGDDYKASHAEPTKTKVAGSFRLIGQYRQSYLLVEHDGNLLIIDQHAAHERLNYNRLLNAEKNKGGAMAAQLTLPIVIQFPITWGERLPRIIDLLKEYGFTMDPIDRDSYAIRSVPFLMHNKPVASDIYDLVETLIDGESTDIDEQKELIRKRIACHRSVRAKERLSFEEIEQLLSDWFAADDADHCPHGRPTALKFELGDLEKSFRRKG